MVAAPVTQEEQDAEAANGMGQGAGAGAEGGIVPAPGQGNNDANNAAQGRGPTLQISVVPNLKSDYPNRQG